MTGDDHAEVVRSEERLHVGTLSVPVERVRVRKVVVTEERTVTVTVRREELRVEREPIAPGDVAPETLAATDDGPRLVDLVLHEERVVVEREVVPVERVRVVVDRVSVQQAVGATLSHEEVAVEGDAVVRPAP